MNNTKEFYSLGGFYAYQQRHDGDVLDVYVVDIETGKRSLIASAVLDCAVDKVYCSFDCLEYGVFCEEIFPGTLWNSSVDVVAHFLVAEYIKALDDMERELQKTKE